MLDYGLLAEAIIKQWLSDGRPTDNWDEDTKRTLEDYFGVPDLFNTHIQAFPKNLRQPCTRKRRDSGSGKRVSADQKEHQ